MRWSCAWALLLGTSCLQLGIAVQLGDGEQEEEVQLHRQHASQGAGVASCWGWMSVPPLSWAVAVVDAISSAVSKISGLSSFTGVTDDTALKNHHSVHGSMIKRAQAAKTVADDSSTTPAASASGASDDLNATESEERSLSKMFAAINAYSNQSSDESSPASSPSPVPAPEATCADRAANMRRKSSASSLVQQWRRPASRTVKRGPSMLEQLVVDEPRVIFQCSEENRALCHKGDKGPNMACSRDHERCEWDERIEGPYMPCCEKKLLFELFIWFRNLMSAYKDENPDFWYIPVYGSLLAARRNCDLIDHDTDVDIVVPHEHIEWMDKILAKHVEDVSPKIDWGGAGKTLSRLYISTANHVHIDIWYAKTTNETLEISAGSVAREYSTNFNDTFDKSLVFPIDDGACCFQEECFPCPAKPKALLDRWFPKGWQKPEMQKYYGETHNTSGQ
jgi:hypothetical protein